MKLATDPSTVTNSIVSRPAVAVLFKSGLRTDVASKSWELCVKMAVNGSLQYSGTRPRLGDLALALLMPFWLHRLSLTLAGCLFFVIGSKAVGLESVPTGDSEPAEWHLLFIGPEQAVPITVTVKADEGPAAKRRKLAAMLLQRFDTDKNGQLSAAEAVLLPMGAKATGPGLGEQWRTLDRSPVDDSLSVEELTAFVNEQLGPTFQLSTRQPRLAQSVQLVERIDQDHDAAISPAELAAGIAMLRSSDLDDDEAISVGELQPYPRRQGLTRPTTAVAIEAPFIPVDREEDIREAVERVLRAYGQNTELQSVELRRIASLDHQPQTCDTNLDGQLNREELTAWMSAHQPAMTVVASLRQGRPSSIEVVHGTATQTGSKVSVSIGGAYVDLTALNNKSEQSDTAKLYRIRFLTSDRDKNGYLNEVEFAALQLPAAFKDVDANGDGMLYREELTTFVEFDAIAIQSRIEMMVGDEGKTLFELLDRNVDRRLTMREIREGFTPLAIVDRNQDQHVAQSELESRYRLTFSFGRNQLFTPNTNPQAMQLTPRLRSQENGPIWYRRMDRNLDGDITWREFLGSRTQFDQLDQNSDQMIDLTEASSIPVPSSKTEPQTGTP